MPNRPFKCVYSETGFKISQGSFSEKSSSEFYAKKDNLVHVNLQSYTFRDCFLVALDKDKDKDKDKASFWANFGLVSRLPSFPLLPPCNAIISLGPLEGMS